MTLPACCAPAAKWPGGRAAKQRDELAALHSITSSASASSLSVFGNRALHIAARIIVRTSSTLKLHVQFLRSLRRRAASACGGFITIEPRVLPEPERNWKRVDVELLPPCSLITRPMKLAVMDPTNRHGELVAHSVSKGTRLCKREMVRI
jgi:hypothetical protein